MHAGTALTHRADLVFAGLTRGCCVSCWYAGHYRPTDSHLLTLLLFLESQGVNLEELEVDVQLVMKVSNRRNLFTVSVKKEGQVYLFLV